MLDKEPSIRLLQMVNQVAPTQSEKTKRILNICYIKVKTCEIKTWNKSAKITNHFVDTYQEIPNTNYKKSRAKIKKS